MHRKIIVDESQSILTKYHSKLDTKEERKKSTVITNLKMQYFHSANEIN